MASHYAQEPTLTGVLTSLFLVQPPTLLPEQLSENLRMRHRLLGIPSTPPIAYELDGADPHSLPDSTDPSDYAVPVAERKQSRLNFASWLVTNLGDNEQGTNLVDRVAEGLFVIRDSLRRLNTHRSVEQDVVYAKLCSTAWHQGEGKRLVLLQLPINKQHALTLTLIRSPDGSVRFENITNESPVDGDGPPSPESLLEHGLHPWTHACDTQGDEAKLQDQGAEYIVNPNDFWSGYDDQDEPNRQAADVAPPEEVEADDYWASYDRQPQDEQDAPHNTIVTPPTVQLPDRDLSANASAAVKDIIRGALSLYKSSHPTHNKQHFLALVSQTLQEE